MSARYGDLRRILATLVAAVLALAVLVVLPGAESHAAFPGDNGRLVGTNGGIFTINPDGTGYQQVTTGFDHSPMYSPDGRRIAFENLGDVYVIRTDGTGRERLTNRPGQDGSPAWSPDGKTIIFLSDRSGKEELWRLAYPAPYGEPRQITSMPEGSYVADSAVWSPRGDRIAVDIVEPAKPEDLVPSPSDPPNLVTRRLYVYTMRPDGTDMRQVDTSGYDTADPEWSPDGSRLAMMRGFRLTDDFPPFDIVHMDPYAPDPYATMVNLTGPLCDRGGYSYAPIWSPDGREIRSNTDPSCRELEQGTWAFSPDGSDARLAFHELVNDWQARPTGPEPNPCTITGTPGDDVLHGTPGPDVICGLGGNDRIYANGGKDVVNGDEGHDVIFGGAGSDHLRGGPGNDTIHGQAGWDTINGGKGRDMLFGHGGNDTFWAKDFWRDKVDGGSGTDRARIDPLKDVLTSVESIF